MTTAIGAYATATSLKARAGITDSTDDTLLGSICDQVNQYIESRTGRVLAPITSADYTYDSDGGTRLWLARPTNTPPIGGLRAITAVYLQRYTGAGYESIPTSQVFLRQRVGMTGPFEVLEFTDQPSAGFSTFPPGYNTVKLTATAGWAAIPDDIIDVALTAATRAWFARQSGQQDVVGNDEMGQPIVSRFFSARDLGTLRSYTIADFLA